MGMVTVEAPASKSLSHRLLIATGLSRGDCELTNVLESDDIARTMDCLSRLGARFGSKDGVLHVRSLVSYLDKDLDTTVELDVGESGTTCRLITAVAAALRGRFRISGSGRMHERPIAGLTSALEKLGVRFSFEGRPGCPPFFMESDGLAAGETEVSLEESSQYLSGLLLAAPLAAGKVCITITGNKAVSWPYVALTLKVMSDFKIAFAVEALEHGVWKRAPWRSLKSVEPGRVRFLVKPSQYAPCRYRVEGDWSNGSYFLAAGAIGPNPVRVEGLCVDSLQGDRQILDILTRMGAKAAWDEHGVTVSPGRLQGVDIDMGRCPDLVPTVAVTAAAASGQTVIRNVAHLRIKESDRLAALAAEIRKVGCGVEVLADGLSITPAPLPKSGRIKFATHSDHRLAMSMSLFGLAGIEAALDLPSCVSKSFPGFFTQWAKVLAAARGEA